MAGAAKEKTHCYTGLWGQAKEKLVESLQKQPPALR